MYVCLNRGTVGSGADFEQFVHIAADAGFAGADVDLAYATERGASAFLDLFSARNLRFGGWGLPVEWRGDLIRMNAGLEELDAQARVAHQLGIDSCSTWLLPSSDLPFIENWNFHVQRLRPIAERLANHGLRFGLEFVAPYHLRRMKRHEFIFTAGQILELADAVGENVGLLVDCFHCHAAGDTWNHLGRIPGNRIVLAHLNDAPNVPLHQIQDGERLLPGAGVIDQKAFIAALERAGYAGPVSLEVFNAELRAMPPAQAARKAWQATARALAGTSALPASAGQARFDL